MRVAVLLILIAAILIAGCSGNQSGKKTPTPTPTAIPTPTPMPTPTGTATPTPVPTETQKQELHGVGTCDTCHDAPTVKDMANGIHKNAFEKQPDIHKTLCKKCHDVKTFCGQCHEVPAIVES